MMSTERMGLQTSIYPQGQCEQLHVRCTQSSCGQRRVARGQEVDTRARFDSPSDARGVHRRNEMHVGNLPDTATQSRKKRHVTTAKDKYVLC